MRGAADLHPSYPGTQPADPYYLPHLVPRSNQKHPAVISKKALLAFGKGGQARQGT